jgi:flagellar motility protein MotE (MotC chaperone)
MSDNIAMDKENVRDYINRHIVQPSKQNQTTMTKKPLALADKTNQQNTSRSINELLLKNRSQDGTIMKLNAQINKRKQQLEEVQKQAEREANALKEALEIKEQCISALESSISILKHQIRRSDGKNTLLRYRLQSMKTQSTTAGSNLKPILEEPNESLSSTEEAQYDRASGGTNEEAWFLLRHYQVSKAYMTDICNLHDSPDNNESRASTEKAVCGVSAIYDQQQDSLIDLSTLKGFRSDDMNKSLLKEENELRQQLEIQRRLNERLKEQLHKWVDTQIELHTHLATTEIRTTSLSIPDLPPAAADKQHSVIQKVSSLPDKSPAIITTKSISDTNWHREVADEISMYSMKTPSPKQLKALFAGHLSCSKVVSLPIKSPAVVTTKKIRDTDWHREVEDEISMYSMQTPSPKGLRDLFTGLDSKAYPTHLNANRGKKDRKATGELSAPVDNYKLVKRGESTFTTKDRHAFDRSPTDSSNTFNDFISDLRSENSMVNIDMQRFQTMIQVICDATYCTTCCELFSSLSL